MRSKFSELIAQGIARFNYTPIIQETPCTDPICLEYNNIFGPAMDTHMSMLEDGTRVITGHRVADECEWANFANSYRWNGIDFHDSGYHTLNEFLDRYNLTYTRGILNGDVVICVTECTEPIETEMPRANESLNESKEISIKPTFNLQNDVYNVLSELGFAYESKNKSKLFEQDKMEKALKWFLDKFYEENNEEEDDN